MFALLKGGELDGGDGPVLVGGWVGEPGKDWKEGGGVGCWAQWSTTGEKKSVEKRARSGAVPYKLLSAAL